MKKIVIELRHIFNSGHSYPSGQVQSWQEYRLFKCEFVPDENQLGEMKNRI